MGLGVLTAALAPVVDGAVVEAGGGNLLDPCFRPPGQGLCAPSCGGEEGWEGWEGWISGEGGEALTLPGARDWDPHAGL